MFAINSLALVLLVFVECLLLMFADAGIGTYGHNDRLRESNGALMDMNGDYSRDSCGGGGAPKIGMGSSIASEMGSNIAQMAAREAVNAFLSQTAKGQAADYKIKALLAQQATIAAKAGHAAYLAKKQILKNLYKEAAVVATQIKMHTKELEKVKCASASDAKIFKESKEQMDAVRDQVQRAKTNLDRMAKGAKAAHDMVEQLSNSLNSAKEHNEDLVRKMKKAELQFKATKQAAEKAAAAAHAAREEANRGNCSK